MGNMGEWAGLGEILLVWMELSQSAWSHGAPLPSRCVMLGAISGDVTQESWRWWQVPLQHLPKARCSSLLYAVGSTQRCVRGCQLCSVLACRTCLSSSDAVCRQNLGHPTSQLSLCFHLHVQPGGGSPSKCFRSQHGEVLSLNQP